MRSFPPVAALAVVLALLVFWCPRPSDPGTPAVPAPTAEPSSREAGPREPVLDVAVEGATPPRAERELAAVDSYAEWVRENRGAIQVVDEFTGDPQDDAVGCSSSVGAAAPPWPGCA